MSAYLVVHKKCQIGTKYGLGIRQQKLGKVMCFNIIVNVLFRFTSPESRIPATSNEKASHRQNDYEWIQNSQTPLYRT